MNRDGRGSGLTFLWKIAKHYSIQSYSNNHIEAIIHGTRVGNCRLNGYYSHPEGSRRRTLWNLIQNLTESSILPWCILGDFHDILLYDEKRENGKA